MLKKSKARLVFIRNRTLSDTELEFTVRQLSALLAAGIPLEKSLAAIASQSRAPVSDLLNNLRARLREGLSFSQALSLFPNDFPEGIRGLVSVGEVSGNLADVLARIADSLTLSNEFRHGVLSAIAYPLIVCLVALMVVVALMTYVVPQIVSVLDAQRQELPTLTRILIFFSDVVSEYGLTMLFIVFLIVLSISISYLNSPGFRLFIDGLVVKTPFLGSFVTAVESARLASTLSSSLLGGTNLIKAIAFAVPVVTNRDLRARLERSLLWVREGAEFGKSLVQVGGFPPLFVELISTGERSGELPKMLRLAAEQLSLLVKRKTFLLTAFLEPILILSMGGFVLFIVLAVMMPLIEMNTMLR